MERNDFMLLNDLIYQIYTETSFHQTKIMFLDRLKKIIPYSYASIIMAKDQEGSIKLTDPICNPLSFQKAELDYLKLEEFDHTNWIIYSPEAVLVRESDMINDRNRLSSPIYQKCYSHYNIFDTLQMSIVYDRKLLAIITIYRTRQDGAFSAEEMFFLQSLSKHLNYVFFTHITHPTSYDEYSHISELATKYELTRREREILSLIFKGLNNIEITEKLSISEHTLQKHNQHIYKKMGVASKIELLKFMYC